jgi:TRAP-type C4-dicarboxylate transport system substrate-binding protein
MVVPATTSVGGIVKEFSMLDFPFSIANGQQADALLHAPLLVKHCQKKG